MILKHSKQLLLLPLCFIIKINNGIAQNVLNDSEKRFNTGLTIGLNATHLYDIKFSAYDKLESGFLTEDTKGLNGDRTKIDVGFGVDISYFFNPRFSMDLNYTKGSMTGANELEYYEAKINMYGIGANYDLKTFSRKEVQSLIPFVRTSLSMLNFETERRFIFDKSLQNIEEGVCFTFGVGAGLRYHINNNFHISLNTGFNTVFDDALTGWDYGKGRNHFLSSTLGVKYTIGKGKHINRHKEYTPLELSDKVDDLEIKIAMIESRTINKIVEKSPEQKEKVIISETTAIKSDDNKSTQEPIIIYENQNIEEVINTVNELKSKQKELENEINQLKNNKSTTSITSISESEINPKQSTQQKNTITEITMLSGIYSSSLFYNQNQTNLNLEHQKELIRVLALMQFNKNARIQISSHPKKNVNTDTGKDVWDKRFQEIKSYLEQNGVDNSKILKIEWDMFENVLSPELNRRVDIIVIP